MKDKVYILNADDTIIRTISREDEIKIRALDIGKEEEQIAIAKEMLKEDMDIKTIAKITKLSVDQIEDLKVKN